MSKITEQQMEDMGIYFAGSKLKPYLYLMPFIGEINIYPSTTISNVLQQIYLRGREEGINEGKCLKIKEFKKVLEIENE